MYAVQLWGTKTVKKVVYGFTTWEQAQKYANKYPNPHNIQTYWGARPMQPNPKITKAIMQNIKSKQNGD